MSARVIDVLEHRAQPHELRDELHDLWRDGFHAGAERVRQRLAVLEDDLNYWYWRATAPDEHAARMAAILTDSEMIAARNATAARWAALDAAEASAS